MTQVFDENNRIVPVTVVAAGPCVVTQVRTVGRRRLRRRPDRLRRHRPAQGEQARGRPLRQGGRHAAPRHLVELRTDDATEYTLGPGDHGRAVRGRASGSTSARTSKGKGFAGVMKRHGFHGVGASPRRAPQPPQAGLHRRLRHPGPGLQGHADGRPDGWRAHHDPEPHGPRGRRREGPAAHQGRRPRPQGRRSCWSAPPPRAPPRREPTSEHRRTETTAEPSTREVDADAPTARPTARSSCPADVFDVQVNIPLIHQVVVAQLAAARQGTHSTKTPRRGPRRWPQAVPPEGHRPRPAGLDPRAAVRRRWRRPRPARRATTPSAHPRR